MIYPRIATPLDKEEGPVGKGHEAHDQRPVVRAPW